MDANAKQQCHRELRQLEFVAFYHVSEAQRILGGADSAMIALLKNDMSYFAQLFGGKSFSGTDNDRKCVQLGAHLGSAAVRLVTIEERLRSLGHFTQFGSFQDLVTEVKGDPALLEEAFEAQLPDCLHILLRDNVGHVEPSTSAGKDWWKARQVILARLSLEQIADVVPKIHVRLRNTLVQLAIL